MIVKISEKDILEGKPANTQYCVLACAFTAAGFNKVAVDTDFIYLNGKAYHNNDVTSTIISEYDSLEEFIDDLEVPEDVVEKWIEWKNSTLSDEEKENGEYSYCDFYGSAEYDEWCQQEYTAELQKFAEKWAGTEIDTDELTPEHNEDEDEDSDNDFVF